MIEKYLKHYETKTDFCKHAGISKSYLYQIEKGLRPIPPRVVNFLAKEFDANRHELRPDIYDI